MMKIEKSINCILKYCLNQIKMSDSPAQKIQCLQNGNISFHASFEDISKSFEVDVYIIPYVYHYHQ